MKVKDLINELHELDPEAPVLKESGEHTFKLIRFITAEKVEFMPGIRGLSYDSYHEYFDEASRTFQTSEIINGVVLS